MLRAKSRVNSSDDSESSDESVKCSAGLQTSEEVQPVELEEILRPSTDGHLLFQTLDLWMYS
ncbi:hypothetical protein ACE01N_18990 [Saccharicrinis sp. FJH2]|uniref:hypothetical protein n=1 Tax=Saccharicrinis sp. FJH65 TaxID=3344659 RepID=UPI0035F3EFB7